MRTLGIFVKQPVPGRVKTRLADELGPEWAAQIYAAFLADVVDRFRNAADRKILGYSPANDEAANYFRILVDTAYELWPQPESSLGERMNAFFERFLRRESDQVVLIGSDSPTLPPDFVDQAFAELREHDCVLGPATDGGYYLIGLRRRIPAIFDEIEWSSSSVLDQTVARLATANGSLAVLPPWYDVDTVADWRLLCGHLRAFEHAGVPHDLPRTWRLAIEDAATAGDGPCRKS